MPASHDDTIKEIAQRHGVSADAAETLSRAIEAGGGRQAQFNHPDLGGMGQWSRGGMIMIGDMFNNALKAKVSALCDDLAAALEAALPRARSDSSAPAAKRSSRWPEELGTPSSTGSQNDMHYAVFPQTQRLAVERAGQVAVYDTGDHRIGGVSQQQSGDQSLRFTSQHGNVELSGLKRISGDSSSPAEKAEPTPAPSGKSGSSGDEIFAHIERLAELRRKDMLTEDEFAAKKAELLARL